MKHSDHGIVKNENAEEQAKDKKRVDTVHETDPKNSVSREATRDPKLSDAQKTPGSGMTPDDETDAPTG